MSSKLVQQPYFPRMLVAVEKIPSLRFRFSKSVEKVDEQIRII